MSETEKEIDVLVVGAGPTGLTMASELLRHGATARIVDRLEGPTTYSKAAVVHARTMECFDAMGIAAEVVSRSRNVRATNVYAGGKRVAHVALDEGIDSPYPHAYGISQRDTEEILSAHLARLGGSVERGVALSSFTQDANGVTATLAKSGAGDASETVRARWLVGCDGAHSAVRKGLGLRFEGAPYEERLIQADLRVAFAQHVEDDEILIFLHERGPAMVFPLFKDGRFRLVLLDATGSTHEPEGGAARAPSEAGALAVAPALEEFERGLADRGIDARVSDPAWTVAFRIHHRHVDRLREGRVFIAGDAAHIHSPVGGQGMNTGIQDAVNLAWKLALAARGKGKDALLDAYESERMPVIRALVASTDAATRALETAVKIRNPIAVGLRDQLMSSVTKLGVVRSHATSALTMLGVGYPSSPICAEDRTSAWSTSVTSSRDREAPGIRDWAAFGHAPAPGSRAVDAVAKGGLGDGTETHVHELLRAGKHVALLFDGAARTEAGYENLIGIARALEARSGGEIEPYLVVPMARGALASAAQWEGQTLFDEDGDVHRRFGARSECVYVIRPDGYVGFRGQPAEVAKILAWVDRWLAR